MRKGDLFAGTSMPDLKNARSDRGIDMPAMIRIGKWLPVDPGADHFLLPYRCSLPLSRAWPRCVAETNARQGQSVPGQDKFQRFDEVGRFAYPSVSAQARPRLSA